VFLTLQLYPSVSCIPVNAEEKKLDIFIGPPTDLQTQKLAQVRGKNNLCAALFLRGGCTTSKHCSFGHDPTGVDDDVPCAFRYFLRTRGCARKGACRLEDCTWGHVCSRSACAGDSQSRREGVCYLTRHAHDMDCNVLQWVPKDESAPNTFEKMAKTREGENAVSRAAAVIKESAMGDLQGPVHGRTN
jgi:hypothetical protein